jgi:hypothetical protein
MPKILIIPDRLVENVCRKAVEFANTCQSDFDFYVIPNTDKSPSIFNQKYLEVFDTEKYFSELKKINNYEDNDLVIRFYNGILQATNFGLSNLFCAGSKYDDEYPLAAVISLKYLDWEVLEEKYSYEVQKHSILHLIIRCIIGAYTHVDVHMKNNGCIMDFNGDLTSFNMALRKGYYLCEEYQCYQNLMKENYGKSILRLCEKFKNSNYQTIINELIMGDKNIFNNSQIGAVGSNSTSSNNSFQQINYNVPEDLDYDKLHGQLTKLRENLATQAKSPEEFKAIGEVAEAEMASKDKDGNKVVKHLKSAGKWVFDTAKDIGVDVVTELIKKQMEL